MTSRNKIGVLVAEFFGTAILTSTILAEATSSGFLDKSWFITATAGITLTMLVLTLGAVSGAHLNPAVTIGMWTLRKIETTTAIAYISVQLLGGAVALRLFQFLQNDSLQNSAGNFEWRIFVAEAIGTFIFTFGIAAAITQKLTGFKAAFTIGASFMLGGIVAAIASHGFLNPAVALGNNSWSWTYAAAPIVGSVLGMNVYDLFLAPESSLKNPLSVSKEVTTSSAKTTIKKKTTKKAKN